MMKITISLILSSLALQVLSAPHPPPSYVDGDGDGGDYGDGGVDTPTDVSTDITPLNQEATSIDDAITTIPQYNCGYSNVDFDTSLNTFAKNDTVWFYGDDSSNCKTPNGQPCTGYMYMTGNYGDYFGYMPYSVWYTFKQQQSGDWMVTLRYNYNQGQTSVVDSVICDGNEYKSSLNRCMFNEELYSYEFFKYYQFNFYTTCTYNPDTDTMYFNLDQESRTCVSKDGTTNDNRFTLANFDDWCPKDSFVVSDENDFCPNCEPKPTTVTETATVTNTATQTETVTNTVTSTSTPCPTPTPTCVSCGSGGDNIVVNVNVNSKNKGTVAPPPPVVPAEAQ